MGYSGCAGGGSIEGGEKLLWEEASAARGCSIKGWEEAALGELSLCGAA